MVEICLAKVTIRKISTRPIFAVHYRGLREEGQHGIGVSVHGILLLRGWCPSRPLLPVGYFGAVNRGGVARVPTGFKQKWHSVVLDPALTEILHAFDPRSC